MAKLKSDRIESVELIEFLDGWSDFGFELKCVERLSRIGLSCEHGGSYVDRVTNKARQFDIRARGGTGASSRVRCAVECKNLSESFPLMIMCVPRAVNESFHELVFSFVPKEPDPARLYSASHLQQNCRAVRLPHPVSGYGVGSSVGKSVVQVGKGQDNSIVANDAEVFEKWSQALASAHDLADEAATEGEEQASMFISLILPILVVPDGTLWKVDYSESGSRTSDPSRVNRCSFFVGRDIATSDRMRGTRLTISHLEFVTLSGLEELTRSILNLDPSWFPDLSVVAKLARQL